MSDKTYTADQVAIEVLKKYSELAKADACKADEVEKCGEMKTIKKADDSKLKAFLENKKAKKTSKMEKMLGMNQAPAQQASTGTEAPKPKINMPGDKQK